MNLLWIQHLIVKKSSQKDKFSQTIKQIISFLFLIPFLIPQISFAHPHSWIRVHTQIEGDASHITGLSMQWEFDAMTSTMTLDGEDLSEAMKEQTLQNLADEVLANMLNEHYFTYFYTPNKTPIRYLEAQGGMFELKNGKLILDFKLPLAKPYSIKEQPIDLMIFEPSYYTDISWPDAKSVSLSDELSQYCHLEMIKPTPTPEQMTYAMSLPPNADPDNALGQLFTQTLKIHCSDSKEK